MKFHRQTPRKKSGGFSLIEIMVAMIIGLLGTIVIFQVFSVSERQKRTTVSGGDAQQNGAIALFSLEQDARMAGFGINHPALLGCPIRWYVEGDNGPPKLPDRGTEDGNLPLTMVPIVITQGAGAVLGVGGAADTITITYGSSDLAGIPGKLKESSGPSANYKVDSRYGYNPGPIPPPDLVVVAQAGQDCTLAGVTGVPGGGQSDNIIHNSGGGGSTAAIYNRPGGLGVTYTAGASVINLGPAPTINVYSILNNSLALQAMLGAAATTPIVDGIVQLQARYGRDTTVVADGVIDVWDTTTPPAPVAGDTAAQAAAKAAEWSRILAVRIAVVARSSQRERAAVDAAGVCTTTTVAPQWLSDPITNVVEDIDVSGDVNWRCYRYKTFQTAVSLRNMIWRPPSP